MKLSAISTCLESLLPHLRSREIRPKKRLQRWQLPMEAVVAWRSAPSPLLCRHQDRNPANHQQQRARQPTALTTLLPASPKGTHSSPRQWQIPFRQRPPQVDENADLAEALLARSAHMDDYMHAHTHVRDPEL